MSEERNRALEEAAQRIERLAGNQVYQQAWRRAAKVVRQLKMLTDNEEQISSTSSSDGETISPVVKAGAR